METPLLIREKNRQALPALLLVRVGIIWSEVFDFQDPALDSCNKFKINGWDNKWICPGARAEDAVKWIRVLDVQLGMNPADRLSLHKWLRFKWLSCYMFHLVFGGFPRKARCETKSTQTCAPEYQGARLLSSSDWIANGLVGSTPHLGAGDECFCGRNAQEACPPCRDGVCNRRHGALFRQPSVPDFVRFQSHPELLVVSFRKGPRTEKAIWFDSLKGTGFPMSQFKEMWELELERRKSVVCSESPANCGSPAESEVERTRSVRLSNPTGEKKKGKVTKVVNKSDLVWGILNDVSGIGGVEPDYCQMIWEKFFQFWLVTTAKTNLTSAAFRDEFVEDLVRNLLMVKSLELTWNDFDKSFRMALTKAAKNRLYKRSWESFSDG